jgi:flagella basal body P-ring formation protein FlgA
MHYVFRLWIITTIALVLTSTSGAQVAIAAEWTPIEQIAAANQPAREDMITPLPDRHYFELSTKDLERAVATQLQEQNLAEQVRATVLPSGTPIFYRADHPITLKLMAMQVDAAAKRWQANAHIIANGKTERVTPVSGRYDELIAVPILKRQITNRDVIAAEDLETQTIASSKLRQDIITDKSGLIGRSARRTISANRPVRTSEVMSPIVISKGANIEMVYRTPYIAIRTSGEALEDGTTGAIVRVKNIDSGRAVSAKVLDANRVEVNPTQSMN